MSTQSRRSIRPRALPIQIDLALGGGEWGTDERLLRGVIEYSRAHTRWHFRSRYQRNPRLPEILRESRAEGFLVSVHSAQVADVLRELGKPTVNVAGDHFAGLAEVQFDHEAVGRKAAEHLADLHLADYAYFGWVHPVSLIREKAFRDRLLQAGGAPAHIHVFSVDQHPATWEQFTDERLLARWLAALPKPIGIFAFNDEIASTLVEHSELLGLHVPNNVAVLGVDDMELPCQHSRITLSSVAPDFEAIGRVAAQILDRMLHGEKGVPKRIVLPPREVVRRRSTSRLVFDDPLLNDALNYVREKALDGISLEDVLQEVPVSRRTLDRHFRQALGHTVHDEIQKCRLEQAQMLLKKTDLSITDVAVRSGFSSLSAFCQIYHRVCGCPPGVTRRNRRKKGLVDLLV